jgi:hypothetical protein
MILINGIQQGGAGLDPVDEAKVDNITVENPVNLDDVVAETDANTNHADGPVTDHTDVSNAGSGAIITVAERNAITENSGKVSADESVETHSDISSKGSGAIITDQERIDLGIAKDASHTEHVADDVEWSTEHEHVNSMKDVIDHVWSAGACGGVDNFKITKIGSGGVTVTDGYAVLRNDVTSHASLDGYHIPASGDIYVANNKTSIIYIDQATQSVLHTDAIDQVMMNNQRTIIYAVNRVDDALNIVDFRAYNVDYLRKNSLKDWSVNGIEYGGGAFVTDGAVTHTMQISSGLFFLLNTVLTTPEINTDVTHVDNDPLVDIFDYVYTDGDGDWDRNPGSTVINKLQYDTGTGLANIGNKDFGCHYVYTVLNSPSHYVVVLGKGSYSSYADAIATPVPSGSLVPPDLAKPSTATHIATIITKQDNTWFYDVLTPFYDNLVSSFNLPITHNEHNGIQGGDDVNKEYYHITEAQEAAIGGSIAKTALITVASAVDLNDMPVSEDQQAAINNAVVGMYDHIGGYNGTTNVPSLDDRNDPGTPIIADILKGHTYTVEVEGTFFGESVEVGDHIISNQDDPSELSHWSRVNKNISFGSTQGTACEGNDGRLPSVNEKAAMKGTEVGDPPSATNEFITNDDARLSDDRDPNTHAGNHISGGEDPIREATNGQNGLATASHIQKIEASYSVKHSHVNKVNLDTIDQNMAKADSPEFAGATIGGVNFNDTLALMHNPTGFDRMNVASYGTLTLNGGTTRTVTHGLNGQDIEYYRHGVKISKTEAQVTTQFPNTEGLWFIYYNETDTLVITQTPWNVAADHHVFVAILYWDAVNEVGVLGEERHGLMDPYTHDIMHHGIGSLHRGGFDPTFTIGNGSADAHCEIQGFTAGSFSDEDIINVNDEQTTYEVWWKEGSETAPVWRWETASAAAVSMAGSRPYWNQLTGGTWQRTEMTDNDYMCMHPIALNRYGVTNKVILIMGENLYETAAEARVAAPGELNTIRFGSLPSPETMPIGTYIVHARNKNNNVYNAAIVLTDDGREFIDYRGRNSVGDDSGNSGTLSKTVVPGTTYTLIPTDNGKIIEFTSATAVTLTVPVDLSSTFNCTILQSGAGQITIVDDGTSTVNNADNFFTTEKPYVFVSLLHLGSNNFVIDGRLIP